MAPRTKRRRTDNVNAAEPQFLRSPEFWFDDGNIILQVESTQFRLAKSVLSMHSSVFCDMFMMPLPANEPTVEGCPVVILSGDTVQDWVHLLGAMYPKSLMEDLPCPELVAAILRLSIKYDLPLFRKECLRRLKTEFPTTLEEFTALCGTTGADRFFFLFGHFVISAARTLVVASILIRLPFP
ncbi:hypothetical protein B0H19DRAFT_1227316 [Mycena capillaripes]|nr:hypothetical protein B0H19DRAFT_1227316 [Mycena capillaripes]